jgi:hypothetical protein
VGDAVTMHRDKTESGELVTVTVTKLAAGDDGTDIRYVGV